MEEIRNIINKLLAEFVEDVRANSIAQGKYTTGRTIKTMERRERSVSEDAVQVDMYAAPYIWALDTGSAPARRRGTDAERQAFISNLTEWCRTHAMPKAGMSEAQYRNFAKFLKWYIGKHGSWLYRHPANQHRVIAPAMATLEESLSSQIADSFTDTITILSTKNNKKIVI